MRKSILLLFTGGAIVFTSFKINEKLQNKPIKIYREGNTKIVVWENQTADQKVG